MLYTFVAGVIVGLAWPRVWRDLGQMRTAWALKSWMYTVADTIRREFDGSTVFRERRGIVRPHSAFLTMLWRDMNFLVIAAVEPGWRARKAVYVDERAGGFLVKSHDANHIAHCLRVHLKLPTETTDDVAH
jgi:hypothetical protein